MDRRISFLKIQMSANLKHQFTVKEMAEMINVSNSHLQKLFVKDTGISPIEYLRQLRIKKVKNLLEEDGSFKRLKEICYEVGVKDQSHFIKDFKQRYGLTPAKYRDEFWAKPQKEKSAANK